MSTITPLGVDTFDTVKVGDHRPTDLMISNLAPWCMALEGGNRDGYMCSRNKGHQGRHIAAHDVVVAVW